MILVFQMILYLLLFTEMVALVVRGGAVNGLFFYPKPVQERAFALGLADREHGQKKKTVHGAVLPRYAGGAAAHHRRLEQGPGF